MSHSIRTYSAASPGVRRRRVVLCGVIALAALLPCGCVRRRLNVRTNPPGALIYVDNQVIGTTPCGVDFTYYGTREIRLVKPGFETLSINQPIPTPWYEFPPLDFVSENLVPSKIRDNRTVIYDLRPQVIIPPHVLVERGEELRRDANSAPSPLPAVVSPPPGVVVPTGPAIPAPSFTAPASGVPAPPANVVAPPTSAVVPPSTFAPPPM